MRKELDQPPAYFEEAVEQFVEDPYAEKYWSCTGDDPTLNKEPAPKQSRWEKLTSRWRKQEDVQPEAPREKKWTAVFQTAEEAEAFSATYPVSDTWVWNKKPARQFTVRELVQHARQQDRLGVQLQAWSEGKWKGVKKWPIGEPML
ncbi:MAG TPA: hypothetical protein VLA04_05430 [Verrucomicrobiae bacterium]|nr:hypothetical protein [Verrucomicrobiae bacterium]